MHNKTKISFCTVCMNRLHQLKKTLPKNIEDNASYGNVEFLVLDYNSNDGLEEWIINEMGHHLDSGMLVYLKTETPRYFLRSHSKNCAGKNASGAIVCNVDADNYIGQGFAEYINQQFTKDANIYLAVQRNSGRKDCYGRICTWKKDFLAITGYDESMTDYGFEDFDLLNRLNMLGRKPQYINYQKYLKVLKHEDTKRLENEFLIKNIEMISIRYINHYSSELLYFFKKGTFYLGIVTINRLVNSSSIDNIFQKNRIHKFSNSLQNNVWKKGTWHKKKTGFKLDIIDGIKIDLIQVANGKMCDKKVNEIEYHQCGNAELFEELVMFLSQINNRIKMARNNDKKIIRVNEVFGEIDFIDRSLCQSK